MRVAIVTFDGFNELDSFIALGLLTLCAAVPPTPALERPEVGETIVKRGRVASDLYAFGGGVDVGAHLGLLRNYFPGYRVTFFGSLIGFVYAFVLGYAVGRLIGWMYNRLVAGFPDR